jgi:hypothetical protein
MRRFGDDDSSKDEEEEKGPGATPAPDAGRVTEALFSPFGDQSPQEALADRLVMLILADDPHAKKQLAEMARSGKPEDVELARSIAKRILDAEKRSGS